MFGRINAVVTAAQKSNQSSSLSNFLQFQSLFSSKVLERVVFDQVVYHFNRHKLFSNKQSDFQPGHSTQDVLLHVNDSWLRAIDN